ncbi:MAG TPA: 4a-hydroxytetrahydrobiopterin dehydratase [Acidimicrobiaceae bacterium]|nr:4a-hydroxytetrahydrobiopterin dehydratase [Acidimicrobiaceae bacterium]
MASIPRGLLDAAQLDAARARLPDWEVSTAALARRYRFADFADAFGFMTGAAEAAERLDHHPDWSNAYSLVEVSLSTHDRGGVTQFDVTLAAEMEELATALGARTADGAGAQS